jgi:hypothetical protein
MGHSLWGNDPVTVWSQVAERWNNHVRGAVEVRERPGGGDLQAGS